MNAFEDIVGQYHESEGYWVRHSVKVEISKDDKCRIELPTMPRPEIDIVAINVEQNELLLVEVKSYLDSYGVYYEAVCTSTDELSNRYKLFTNNIFRDIVTQRLREQYLEKGLIKSDTKINYGLAAGNIHSGNEVSIDKYFGKRGWKLFTPKMIKDKIRELARKGYEDNLATVTAKLILRD